MMYKTMARFTGPPRAELYSSSWAQPHFLLQRLLLLLTWRMMLCGWPDPSGFSKWFTARPFGGCASRFFFSTEEMSDRRQHFTQACPSFISQCFLPPSPFSRLRTLKVSLPPENLPMSCTISTLAHLPDVFSVLLSFFDVREDQTAADKLHLKINHPCWMVAFLFLVWAWLPQQSHNS